ncbi:hypothetical protein [Bacillus sp. JJ722]|uniref:hypothetical protein n=1 Tax=Bacillus sp. JJ722 TaxID=3122973 RepID=UPI002FFE1B0C
MPKRAREGFSGTTSKPIKLTGVYEELLIINDGTSNLTFTAGKFTFILGPGEVFDEEIDPFSEIEVTATGAYRGYVRDVYK